MLAWVGDSSSAFKLRHDQAGKLRLAFPSQRPTKAQYALFGKSVYRETQIGSLISLAFVIWLWVQLDFSADDTTKLASKLRHILTTPYPNSKMLWLCWCPSSDHILKGLYRPCPNIRLLPREQQSRLLFIRGTVRDVSVYTSHGIIHCQ